MVGRLLVVAMFLTSASVVFWQAFVHTVHRGTLTVPSLTGQTVEEASGRAHDMGLSVVVEEPGVYSAEVPAGTVAEPSSTDTSEASATQEHPLPARNHAA
jgi:hypothetical protein